jgi:hypothetical protein
MITNNQPHLTTFTQNSGSGFVVYTLIMRLITGMEMEGKNQNTVGCFGLKSGVEASSGG